MVPFSSGKNELSFTFVYLGILIVEKAQCVSSSLSQISLASSFTILWLQHVQKQILHQKGAGSSHYPFPSTTVTQHLHRESESLLAPWCILGSF